MLHVVWSVMAANGWGDLTERIILEGFNKLGVVGASSAIAAYFVVTLKELVSMAMFSTFERMKERVRKEGYEQALKNLKIRVRVNVDHATNKATIHDAYCPYATEYSDYKIPEDGGWHGFETMQAAVVYAEATGLNVHVCRICNVSQDV